MEDKGMRRPGIVIVGLFTLSLPLALRAADCNANGIDDLIDLEERTLSSELTGRFAAGATPRDVVVADLDGNGTLDVAAPNRHSASITILCSARDGEGEFGFDAQHLSVATITNPAALVAADFDKDGDIDLATMSTNSVLLVVLVNDGDGTFSSERSFPTGAIGAEHMVAEDLDADGHIDIAIAARTARAIVTAFGDGAGSFPDIRLVEMDPVSVSDDPEDPHVSLLYPRSVQAADIDADGTMDLLVGNDPQSFRAQGVDVPVQPLLQLYSGLGERTFAQPRLLGDGWWSTVADFDGDGELEVVATSGPNRQLNRLLYTDRKPDGNFVTAIIDRLDAPVYLVTSGDLDGDEDDDLVMLSSTDLSVYENLGNGSFRGDGRREVLSSSQPPMMHPRYAALDDVDGDGSAEIYISSRDEDHSQNEIISLRALRAATSSDCNDNGIPDECEDCDSNGIADDCDPNFPSDPENFAGRCDTPVVQFSFAGPEIVTPGGPNLTQREHYDCVVTQFGDGNGQRVSGFSMSILAEGVDVLDVTSVGTVPQYRFAWLSVEPGRGAIVGADNGHNPAALPLGSSVVAPPRNRGYESCIRCDHRTSAVRRWSTKRGRPTGLEQRQLGALRALDDPRLGPSACRVRDTDLSGRSTVPPW